MTHIASFADARRVLQGYWPSNQTKHTHSLEHVEKLMDYLGNPQDKLQVIHVAGTSGKTSTAYYAAALLHAAGKKVGLTVSPHVDEVNERVQIDMVPLPEQEFCSELEIFLKIIAKSGLKPHYFEIFFAFACWEYVRQKVDYAVIEVGIGGLLDTTNVIHSESKLCIITDIGLDHVRILGDTLGKIAQQKAGIIQLHNSVFCYRQSPDIMGPIELRARAHQADVHILKNVHEDTHNVLPLFQQRNLALALAAVAWLLKRTKDQAVTKDMVARAAHTAIPARMEVVTKGKKTIVMDAAHNSQKLGALRRSVQARYKNKPAVVLVSMLTRHDSRLEDAARELVALGDHIVVTTFSGTGDGPKHSMDTDEFVAACKTQGALSIEVVEDPTTAYRAVMRRPEPLVIVTGSFYLLNHIRPLI